MKTLPSISLPFSTWRRPEHALQPCRSVLARVRSNMSTRTNTVLQYTYGCMRLRLQPVQDSPDYLFFAYFTVSIIIFKLNFTTSLKVTLTASTIYTFNWWYFSVQQITIHLTPDYPWNQVAWERRMIDSVDNMRNGWKLTQPNPKIILNKFV